jgi:uncharacterized protein YlxP (DUF503 family)
MVVGVLQAEVHIPNAQSLKDKRSVMKSLRDQLRGRFNVAVAEVEPNEKWQRAMLGIAAVGGEKAYVAGLLREVSAWLRAASVVELIRLEEDYVESADAW